MVQVSRAQMSDLRKQLKDAGCFEKAEGTVWRNLFLLIGALAALTAVSWFSPTWVSVLLLPLQAIVMMSAAMFGHEGSHKSLSGSSVRNEAMGLLCFPFGIGFSLQWWSWEHNGPHHTHPNHLDEDRLDPHLYFFPYATHQDHYEQANPLVRFFQRHLQKWAFWPSTLLIHMRMKAKSARYLAGRIGKYGLEPAVKRDLAAMAAHYVVYLGTITALFASTGLPLGTAFLTGFAWYFSLLSLTSVVAAIIFMPAHVGLPTVSGKMDFFTQQFYTTRDIALPRWLSPLYVGLDYQIAHHLFPSISYVKLAEVTRIGKAWAKENNVPWRAMGFVEGLQEVNRSMSVAWKTPSVVHGGPEVASAAR